MRTILDRLRHTYWGALLGLAVGAGGLGAYAHFIGCASGTCPLTSNVWTASLFGGVVGMVVAWPSRREAVAARGEPGGEGEGRGRE